MVVCVLRQNGRLFLFLCKQGFQVLKALLRSRCIQKFNFSVHTFFLFYLFA